MYINIFNSEVSGKIVQVNPRWMEEVEDTNVEAVTPLYSKTLDKFVSDNQLVLVLFYADWYFIFI